MLRVTAKEILNTPIPSIWEYNDNRDVTVVFDDNTEVQTKGRKVIFNRYCWELFHLFPKTTITNHCSVESVIGNGNFHGGTHIELLERIFDHISRYNEFNSFEEKEPLLKRTYEVVNLIYNEIVLGIGGFVSVISATDFTEVVKDPVIKDIHRKLDPTPEGIDVAYKAIRARMMDKSFTNRLAKAYRCKAINDNQANQCIGPRGFVADLDKSVFKRPVKNGFITGMGDLYEILVESRTAAKALNASSQDISNSEYASRRLQLLAMPIDGIHNGDCGSEEYASVLLDERSIKHLNGKYYLDTDGKLKYIKGDETHLFGTMIKFRSVIGCQHHDVHKVCSTCAGRAALNIRSNSNIGYLTLSDLMAIMSQSILSTKHLLKSVVKILMKLTGDATLYFSTRDNFIYLNPNLDLSKLELIIATGKGSRLSDALSANGSDISLNKIGGMDYVIVRDHRGQYPKEIIVDIGYDDRESILTRELLEYMRKNNCETDSRGNFVVNLGDWGDIGSPLFYNPVKEETPIKKVNRLTRLIETNKIESKRLKPADPYTKLQEIYSLITEDFGLDENILIAEIAVYATMVHNPAENDFRLGRFAPAKVCGTSKDIFSSRSLGQLLLFEEQANVIFGKPYIVTDPIRKNRHPMDVLFAPQETLVK